MSQVFRRAFTKGDVAHSRLQITPCMVNVHLSRIRSPCCAPAASGHDAAAPPSRVKKSRRFIGCFLQAKDDILAYGPQERCYATQQNPSLMSELGHERRTRSGRGTGACLLRSESDRIAASPLRRPSTLLTARAVRRAHRIPSGRSPSPREIGRASCRERGEMSGGARAWKE